MTYLETKCWLKRGPLELPGEVGNYFKKTILRKENAIITEANPAHVVKLLELLGLTNAGGSTVPGRRVKEDDYNKQLLEGDQITLYRQAVGLAMYIAGDREDIKFSTK